MSLSHAVWSCRPRWLRTGNRIIIKSARGWVIWWALPSPHIQEQKCRGWANMYHIITWTIILVYGSEARNYDINAENQRILVPHTVLYGALLWPWLVLLVLLLLLLLSNEFRRWWLKSDLFYVVPAFILMNNWYRCSSERAPLSNAHYLLKVHQWLRVQLLSVGQYFSWAQ